MYSDDKGGNWVTSEIAQIYNADYYYVNFFDELNGIIVVGYDKDKVNESSRIYSTSDGGETWNNAGSGPASDIIKGVLFIDENVGFLCYDYKDGMRLTFKQKQQRLHQLQQRLKMAIRQKQLHKRV